MSTTTYAANSLMAYVGADADVVGVSGTVACPDWEGTKVYFFQTSDFSSPGIRQFDIDANGDETLQRSKGTIGIGHVTAGPSGGAATLSYDGTHLLLVSDPANTSQIAKLRAADLTLLTTFGTASSSVQPSSTPGAYPGIKVDGLIQPYNMVGLNSGAVSYLMSSTGLNIGTIHNDIYSIPMTAFTPATDINVPDIRSTGGALLSRHGISSGSIFLLGIPTATTAALGLYTSSVSALTKIGEITPAQIDATWTHITATRGVAYDETDGHAIIGVHTTDAVANTSYIVKLNSSTAAVMWTRAINSLTAYPQSFTNARIRNGTFHYLGSSALVYHITTSTGAVTTETFTGMATPAGPQISDDVTNSIILYGSFTAGASPPTYLGTYMDTGGHHTVANVWMRMWFATTPAVTPPPGNIGGLAISAKRAWSYALDGHTVYVLDLDAEGTFICDTVTGGQWAKFLTSGFGQWDVQNGVMWGNRVVGGDLATLKVWEVSAAALDDNGTDIAHAATGGIQTRSRKKHSVGAVRVTDSQGNLGNAGGATMSLRFSDNNGRTWSNYFTVTMTEGDYGGETAFRSLGSFAAPGRIFELTDSGGPVRIDGVDADLDTEPDE